MRTKSCKAKGKKNKTLNLNVLLGQNAFSYIVLWCKMLFLTYFSSEGSKVSSIHPKYPCRLEGGGGTAAPGRHGSKQKSSCSGFLVVLCTTEVLFGPKTEVVI